MKISARNQLEGKVGKLTKGMVNVEVLIELESGSQITAVITKASAERLKLRKGSAVFALVKASDVMVGVCGGNPDCDCLK